MDKLKLIGSYMLQDDRDYRKVELSLDDIDTFQVGHDSGYYGEFLQAELKEPVWKNGDYIQLKTVRFLSTDNPSKIRNAIKEIVKKAGAYKKHPMDSTNSYDFYLSAEKVRGLMQR